MAYYLARKRGSGVVHLFVGRGEFRVSSCGVMVIRQTNPYKQFTWIKLGSTASKVNVSCEVCTRVAVPALNEEIPEEQRGKNGLRISGRLKRKATWEESP